MIKERLLRKPSIWRRISEAAYCTTQSTANTC